MADGSLKFSADLAKFAKDLDIGIEKVVKKVTLDIFRDIITASPVDTGAYRASHQIALNTPSEEVVKAPKGKSKKRAGRTEALKQGAKLKGFKIPDTVWISNNLPYAMKIEYGGYPDGPKVSGGYPTQMNGAKGVYRLAIQKAEERFDKAFKEMK